MQNLVELITEMQSEFPGFRFVPKAQSPLMKWLGTILKIVTLGSNRTFLDAYTTTINHVVYTPRLWNTWNEASKITLLRHERVHMRQQARMGTWRFRLWYMLPFFPVFFAYGRTQLEKEAYTESIRSDIAYKSTGVVWSQEYQDHLVNQFTGPAYFWMWVFPSSVKKWVRDTVDECVDEYFENGKIDFL